MDNREELVRELETLRSTLKNLGGACGENGAKEILAILKLCPGLPMDDWTKVSENHNFKEFLALPLDGDIYPQLSRLQKTLDALTRQTETDPLTGLANRRAFERVLDLEVERARRNTTPVSLALIDLDDFKEVNDTHGHACGDQVLVEVAKTLQTENRRYDLAARIGGEEFAVVLSGAGLVKAQSMIHRFMEAVRNLSVNCEGKAVSTSCSVGLACYKGRAELTMDGLFDLADKALYEAKGSGKDRLVSAPIPDMAVPPPDKSLVKSNEKQFLFTGVK